ncbi:hypothetical protein GIB67_027950, partial [Kingdonia uniflora]
ALHGNPPYINTLEEPKKTFSNQILILFSKSEKMVRTGKSFGGHLACLYSYLVFHLNPFWIQLFYFITVSFVGFLVLIVMDTRTNSFNPSNFNTFFMSVSASTVSSMSTVEMEVFSNAQLIVLTILMFVGGEVFTSLLGLQLAKTKLRRSDKIDNNPTSPVDHIELGYVNTNLDFENKNLDQVIVREDLKNNSYRYLVFVVLGFLLVTIVGGLIFVTMYLIFVPSASEVLQSKGLKLGTFSVFTVVSTFTNCGFVPTNENMIVFKNNSGLLLLLIPQVLFGNTLYPSCLRLVIWSLARFTKKPEFGYMLENTREMGYTHLFSGLHSWLLVVTVFGFILVQFILFCSLEWSSGSLDGLNSYEKVVGALFQTVNSRHTGESIVDISIISPAILVLFVVMMYLPPYTSFLPIKDDVESLRSFDEKKKGKAKLIENILFSHLGYLVIFIILICITERKKMKDDPINFSILNIVIEVISGYGNVGFTTGYSCKKQLNADSFCKDAWYGFVGRWGNGGKLILIVVMYFGRLKKFNMQGGRAWKLL